MPSDEGLRDRPDCRPRDLWQALADHWFEDLPHGEQLHLPVRWLVATAGVASFLISFILLSSPSILSPQQDTGELLFLLIGVVFCVGLGFLLAWKRKQTGPVRLYVSGVALPAFLFLAARSGTFLGMSS